MKTPLWHIPVPSRTFGLNYSRFDMKAWVGKVTKSAYNSNTIGGRNIFPDTFKSVTKDF